jgi:hypothetical protein
MALIEFSGGNERHTMICQDRLGKNTKLLATGAWVFFRTEMHRCGDAEVPSHMTCLLPERNPFGSIGMEGWSIGRPELV